MAKTYLWQQKHSLRYSAVCTRLHSAVWQKELQCLRQAVAKTVYSQAVFLWVSVLLILACLLPLCLFGRDVMYKDNRIETFNALNLTTDTYTAQDYLHLTFCAYRTRSGRHGVSHWDEFSVTIEMKGGKEYTFSCYDFDGTADERLDYMSEIKSLFPREAITFQNADRIGEVADRQNMTDAQRAKLYELFGLPS